MKGKQYAPVAIPKDAKRIEAKVALIQHTVCGMHGEAYDGVIVAGDGRVTITAANISVSVLVDDLVKVVKI